MLRQEMEINSDGCIRCGMHTKQIWKQTKQTQLMIIGVVEGYINLHFHADGVMLMLVLEYRGDLIHATGVITSAKYL